MGREEEEEEKNWISFAKAVGFLGKSPPRASLSGPSPLLSIFLFHQMNHVHEVYNWTSTLEF